MCKVKPTERTCCYLLFHALFDRGKVAFSDDSSDLVLDS